MKSFQIVLQIERLNNTTKFKILATIIVVALLILIPLSSPNFTLENQYHVALHISSVIAGTFLSIMGFLTYKTFRTTRLMLVMFAFMSITSLELFSIVSFIVAPHPPIIESDSLITHGNNTCDVDVLCNRNISFRLEKTHTFLLEI